MSTWCFADSTVLYIERWWFSTKYLVKSCSPPRTVVGSGNATFGAIGGSRGPIMAGGGGGGSGGGSGRGCGCCCGCCCGCYCCKHGRRDA
eukprot:SAG31_NODE_9411_length_1282_cov_1.409975_3_plen_89_part_01